MGNAFDIEVEVEVLDVNMVTSTDDSEVAMNYEASEMTVGGTKDYNDLFHKPTFNGTELKGDMELSDVGGVSEEDYMSLEEIEQLFRTL